MTEFEVIYTEHFQDVNRYVYSLCRDASLAEEITQEAFFRAMESLDKFNGNCRIYVWLCQIAKNTYFTYTKKQRRYIQMEEITSNIPSETDMEGCFADRQNAQRIYEALKLLEKPYQEVFSLRIFGELPFEKIGLLFGKTDSWARLVFYRAKQKLRRTINEDQL